MQTWHQAIKLVGDRLLFTFINIGSQADADDSDDSAGESHLCIEVDCIVGTSSGNKATEATTPSKESTKCGVDTNTNGDNTEYYQRNSHCQWSLMWSVCSMKFLVLCTPEDTVVQTEHIESCHSSNTCHNPSYYWAISEASCDNLILRAEA